MNPIVLGKFTSQEIASIGPNLSSIHRRLQSLHASERIIVADVFEDDLAGVFSKCSDSSAASARAQLKGEYEGLDSILNNEPDEPSGYPRSSPYFAPTIPILVISFPLHATHAFLEAESARLRVDSSADEAGEKYVQVLLLESENHAIEVPVAFLSNALGMAVQVGCIDIIFICDEGALVSRHLISGHAYRVLGGDAIFPPIGHDSAAIRGGTTTEFSEPDEHARTRWLPEVVVAAIADDEAILF